MNNKGLITLKYLINVQKDIAKLQEKGKSEYDVLYQEITKLIQEEREFIKIPDSLLLKLARWIVETKNKTSLTEEDNYILDYLSEVPVIEIARRFAKDKEAEELQNNQHKTAEDIKIYLNQIIQAINSGTIKDNKISFPQGIVEGIQDDLVLISELFDEYLLIDTQKSHQTKKGL